MKPCSFINCYCFKFDKHSILSVAFQDWVVLGALDLDDFVDKHLVNLSDWEKNFRALKARGRDAEKLPMEIKVLTTRRTIYFLPKE